MYIVCYDIGRNNVRRRLENLVRQVGVRVQKSVFFCHVDARAMDAVMKKMEHIIDTEIDRISVYYVCHKDQKRISARGQQLDVKDCEFWLF